MKNRFESKPTNAAAVKRALISFIPTAVLLLALHFFGAQMGGFAIALDTTLLPGLISSDSFKRAVMHPEKNDAYSSYNTLGRRGSAVAHDIALQHLTSTDDYLWLNAASYLGCLRDPASIPYLIKALRHTAYRNDEERRQLLRTLTGQDFGTDFDQWQQWWLAQHPDFQLDWESDLGSSPRVLKRTLPVNAVKI